MRVGSVMLEPWARMWEAILIRELFPRYNEAVTLLELSDVSGPWSRMERLFLTD
jgi:hypothetical protein